MPAQRQDYILGQIALLRQFIARLLKRRSPSELDEALQLALHLQEKLFPVPPAEFLKLDIAGQIAALRAGQGAEAGRDRCLTYATLLKETAILYALGGREDLATGARQLALHIVLGIAVEQPAGDSPASVLLAELNAALPHDRSGDPVSS